MIIDLVVINIVHLINPSYQMKRLYRLIVKNKKYVSQEDAQLLYNDTEFDIS